MAASLQHENIVHIYDYWKKPTYCIVMEYVDGANLADVIEKTGALPVDVGIMIAIQVCSALDYAHMRGLVHRDIKPSNIMIKRNGEVKLMDFGIAQSRNLESLTMPGTLIGTPAYMSPEQVLGQQLDARSDIFSFGIVLYEMLTGVKPFTDDEARSVSAKILKDKFLAPRRVNSDIPRGLQRLIKKCLRKKPKRRCGSMLEVEKKLGKRLAGRTTKAASLTTDRGMPRSPECVRGGSGRGNHDHHLEGPGDGASQEVSRCRGSNPASCRRGGGIPLLDTSKRGARAIRRCPSCFAVDRSAPGDASAGNRTAFGPARDLDNDHRYFYHYYHAPCAFTINCQFTSEHFAIVISPGWSEQRTDSAGEEKNRRR